MREEEEERGGRGVEGGKTDNVKWRAVCVHGWMCWSCNRLLYLHLPIPVN